VHVERESLGVGEELKVLEKGLEVHREKGDTGCQRVKGPRRLGGTGRTRNPLGITTGKNRVTTRNRRNPGDVPEA